jgi:hypothetical protein
MDVYSKAHHKYMTVDDGEHLYLYATDIRERLEADKGSYFSLPKESARPLTKSECLRLARILLVHATRGV